MVARCHCLSNSYSTNPTVDPHVVFSQLRHALLLVSDPICSVQDQDSRSGSLDSTSGMNFEKLLVQMSRTPDRIPSVLLTDFCSLGNGWAIVDSQDHRCFVFRDFLDNFLGASAVFWKRLSL